MRTTDLSYRRRSRRIIPVLLLIAGLLATTSPTVGAQPPGPSVQVHMNADFTITEAVNGGTFD
ncbi:MAG: hypothetical protein OEY62_08030, partial [Acidimicrobiia bacterium]|nr:hypothetical protein [Acidimicrobiia bacterium]